MALVQGKVVVIGCSARTGAQFGALLGNAGMSVVTQGYRGLENTMAVLEPDLAIVELRNGDPAGTIALLRGRSDVPVLLLVPPETPSAVTIAAFHAGADDVMEHPVNTQELLVRVEAIMRRRDADRQVRVRDLVIDEAAHLAWRDEQPLPLTPTEFQLLLVLARNVDVVISKRRLLSEVWGFAEFDVNVVEVHVSALRRKLERFGPRLVETVRSHGYVIRAGSSGRAARPRGHGGGGRVQRLRDLTVGDVLPEARLVAQAGDALGRHVDSDRIDARLARAHRNG